MIRQRLNGTSICFQRLKPYKCEVSLSYCFCHFQTHLLSFHLPIATLFIQRQISGFQIADPLSLLVSSFLLQRCPNYEDFRNSQIFYWKFVHILNQVLNTWPVTLFWHVNVFRRQMFTRKVFFFCSNPLYVSKEQ